MLSIPATPVSLSLRAFLLLLYVTAVHLRVSVANALQHQQSQTQNPPIEIPVLYETERILIVNKPHGVSHHTADDGPGILQLLRQQRFDKEERLWGVHRLDKVTSGILVLAKDPEMAAALSQNFAQGKIRKIYFGVSAKKPKKKKQGWVTGGMVRSRRETWMLTKASTATTERSSNFAKTRFFTCSMNSSSSSNVISSDSGADLYGPRTVVMFVPYTGKTHQLRVAAKSMGIALVGDPLYETGKSKINSSSETDDTVVDDNLPLFGRTMLHASGIHIPSEDGGAIDTPVSVWCQPPFFDDGDIGEETPWSLGAASANGFHSAVEKLMTMHCDVSELLDAMRSWYDERVVDPTP